MNRPRFACSLMSRSLPNIRILSVVALALFLVVTGSQDSHAQSAQSRGVDLTTHKFQPKVSPSRIAPSGEPATSQSGIGASAAQQINALLVDKAARTPAQKKISSRLIYTSRMLRGEPVAAGVPFLDTGVDVDDNDNMLVDITADFTDDFLDRLKATGAYVLYSFPADHSVRALVPANQLETIAAWPNVIFIAPKQEARTARVTVPAGKTIGASRGAPGLELRAARVRGFLASVLPVATASQVITNVPGTPGPTGQGSKTTEGDLAHRAFDARAAFGINGAGLKIGVLSDGVLNLAASQALGDLPADVTVLPGQAGPSDSEDEGTAMLEIIHDMAPGAKLYFATAFNGIASFAQNIHDLRTAGCDIIVDDVFYFVESPFADGQTAAVPSPNNSALILQAVNDVTAAGALYFSSAGNQGGKDMGSSSTYEGDFVDGGALGLLAGGTVHNFGTTQWDKINTTSGGPSFLFWSDPLGASTNDYDLFVLNAAATAVLEASTDVQDGSAPQDPVEAVGNTDVANNLLVVFKHASAQARYFHLNLGANGSGTLAVSTQGTTHGHNHAALAYGVAATPAFAPAGSTTPGPWPNFFTTSNQIEYFSADGPRRLFYHADGTPYTPGNVSSTGGIVRQKPDITAADGVSVTGVGGFPSTFYGTSAAAPSAAAVAALVKSAQPTLTNDQLRTTLTATAVDIMASGVDRDSGAGIVMAFEAVRSLGVAGFANPEFGDITATDNPGNGNGLLEAGEGGIVTIKLKNTGGVVDATGITATLTSSTPGVTVTLPGTSTYANMPALSGTQFQNVSPFTFTLASNYPCGQPASFTLTVNYTGGPSPRVLTFTVPTGPQVNITTTLDATAPTPVTGITTATGTQTGRISRNGVASTCATTPKAWPGYGATTGTRTYDGYTFTATQNTCTTVTMSATNGINLYTAAYSPNINPADVQTNFYADAGASSSTQSFGMSTTAGQTYTLIVHDVPAAAASGSTYNLQFSGCAFASLTPNQLPIARAHDVTVTAGVSGTASASIDNGSSDPDGDAITLTQTPAGPYPVGVTNVLLTVVDTKGATAQASANVTVLASDLTVAKVHTGNFVQYQTGKTYTLTVSNAGTGATAGTVTLSDTLPAGLTATAIGGTGWACTLSPLSCTRSDVLAASSSYQPVTVTVDVASNAGASLTNTASVSGGSEPNTTNDSASDPTTVTPASITVVPDSTTAQVVAGQSATTTLTITGNVNFPSSSTPACSTTAPLVTCQFNPPNLTVGTTASRVGITIQTVGPTASNRKPLWPGRSKAVFAMLLSLPMVVFMVPFVGRRRDRQRQRVWLWMGFLLLLLLLSGCGNGTPSQPFTTPGTYAVQVTVSVGTTQGSGTINLTVTQ